MSLESKQSIEGYTFALSENKYSHSVVEKISEKHSFNISTDKTNCIMNMKGKKH